MPNFPAHVLVAGRWRESRSVGTFHAEDPSTSKELPTPYPISSHEEIHEVIEAGSKAAEALRVSHDEDIAGFFELYALGMEARKQEIVETAHRETGLPIEPRLAGSEFVRTTGQLRQAARASREGAWRRPIRDDAHELYSVLAPLGGPVVVFGPNNFPFAYNAVAGGDFVAALIAHNPVIGVGNPGHPGTTGILAEIAYEAAKAASLHEATVQLVYQTPREIGLKLVSHPLVGATGFTGSKAAGLKLKEAADRAGKPIYLEMSSINPVVVLEGALRERAEAVAEEFFASCTMAAGQQCTNPGLVIVPDTDAGHRFAEASRRKFEAGEPEVLLGRGVLERLVESVEVLLRHDASPLCGARPVKGPGYRFENTLLTVSGEKFLKHPRELQTEAFGPVSLLVFSKDTQQTLAILNSLEGNLAGAIYSDSAGADDPEYEVLEPSLRRRVGRLLNDKMPTGVLVSPAMNHGGPYPSTGHPGFTAVGLPASVQRFTALHCYDHVRRQRLPASFLSP